MSLLAFTPNLASLRECSRHQTDAGRLPLEPAILFHHLEDLSRCAGRLVGVAVYSALDIHNMLLQRICFLSIRSLPQDRCQVTHCRQAVGMLLSE